MTAETLNNFSLISRLFGNLFYRSPTDPVLAGVFAWLQQKGLEQVWALDTDKESEQAVANAVGSRRVGKRISEFISRRTGESGKRHRRLRH